MGRRRKAFYKKVPSSAPNEPKRAEDTEGETSTEEACKTEICSKDAPLYPNCDTTIWLRSCEKEVVEPISGKTIGEVPKWLNGSLLRNGPGSLNVGNMSFDHLFDSSALLHKFTIKDGVVTYQNRFLQSETYKRNKEAQRIVVTEFGTSAVPDPCHTIFKRVSAVFNPHDNQSDNAMISIYPFGDGLFAMTEFPIIHQIDPTNLETGKRINLGKKMGIMNHTSHPHVMKDGTVYNLGMAVYKTGPRYCILEFPPKPGDGSSVFDHGKIVATIPCRWRFHPSYMHSFGITKSYFIIVEQPLSVSVASAVKNAVMQRPLAAALRWYQKSWTIIYLISRKTGKLVQEFATDSFFYLHVINQYEENDHVVIDICCYKDPAMLDCMYISALKEAQQNPNYANMFRGRPLRFVLPVKSKEKLKTLSAEDGKNGNLNRLDDSQSEATLLSNGCIFVKPELLCTLGCETPRINYDTFCGNNYRYFYAISSDVDAANPGTLIKVDIKKKTKLTWGVENMYPSEPIFVPKPNSTEEDDGIVLSAVVWGADRINECGIVMLDAKTWTEISRTTFRIDGPVPKCLHGWFVQE